MHLPGLTIAVVGTLLSGCASRPAVTPPDSALVSYTSPSCDSLKRLTIRQMTLDDSSLARIAALPRSNSPWGSRWLTADSADTMHEAPWTTRLYIFDETDRHRCVEVEARDHASYGVHYQWLSDRVVFVRCWWGRIASTDFVLDAETGRPAYIQDANYLKMIQQPER